jgi:hypothetical protein
MLPQRLVTTFMLGVISTSLLTGCQTINPPEYQSQLNKEKHFSKAYFLCETSDWRTGNDTYVSLPETPCSLHVAGFLPSVSVYQHNPSAWNNWRHAFDVKYRIVGLVGPSTSYRVDQVVTGYEFYQKKITIISGSLAGKKAIFEYRQES